MAKDKIRMPASVGGLVRYYDEDYKSHFIFQPQVIIGLCVAIIVAMIIIEVYVTIG